MSWKTLFLTLTFSFSILSAQENNNLSDFFPPSSLVNTDGLANTFINNAVSVISGDFVEQSLALHQDGPHPLNLYYGYSSNGSRSNLGHGWALNLPNRLFITHENFTDQERKHDYYFFYCSEDSGGMFKYYLANPARKKLPKTVLLNNGSASGAVSFSGKHDPCNSSILWDTEKGTCKVSSGSGEVRKFKNVRTGLLQKYTEITSVKPDQNIFEFAYRNSRSSRIREISAFTPTKIPYAHLTFYYNKQKQVDIFSDNLHHVKFEMSKYKVEHKSENKQISKYYLKRISGTDCPLRMYDYHHCYNNTRMLLNSRSSLTGNFIKAKYYRMNDFSVPGLGGVYPDLDPPNSVKYDLCDRVKLLQEPVGRSNRPITTYRFVYHLTFDRYDPRSTDVYDAFLHKTSFHYRSDTLHKIEYFTGTFPNFNLDHTEEYIWNCGKMAAKTDKDGLGNILKTFSFTYDERKNLTSETLQGDLTGHGETQSYTKWFRYSDDGYNNLLTEGEDEGPTIEYVYPPKTDKYFARLVSGDNGIELREFRIYDNHGLCFCEVHDNGSGREFLDLNNVTERVCIFRGFHMKYPLVGKVHTERMVYYDPADDCDKTIKVTKFHYDDSARLIKRDAYDANENFCYSIEYRYDSKGRVIWETDPYGNVIERQFDEEGNILLEKGPDTHVERHYTYDFAHRLIKTEERYNDGKILSTRHHYNHLNQKTESIDHQEQRISYEYDDFGRLTKTTYPAVDYLGTPTNPYTLNEYDTLGNVVRTIDKRGIEHLQKYTVRGDVCETILPDGHSEKHYYTLSGKLKQTVKADGSSIQYTYDRMGNILSEVTYDSENNLLCETKRVWKNKRLIAEYRPNGNATFYQYDALGRTIQEACGNHKHVYEYSSRGYLSVEKEYDGDSLIQMRQREHDYIGRIIEEKQFDGDGQLQSHQKFAYDCAGRKIATCVLNDHAESFCTFTEYDARGRVVKVTDPEGAITRNEYVDIFDGISNGWIEVTVTTDPTGCVTYDRKDSAGRLVDTHMRDIFAALIQHKTLHYDLGGNLLQTKDSLLFEEKEENIQVRQWAYDPNGRMIEEIAHVGTPQQITTQHSYDCMGRKTKLVRPDGIILFWEYDSKGRVAREYDSNQTFDHHYTYDIMDHPIVLHDPLQKWTIERTYNDEEQLIQEKFAPDLALNFTYDSLDRPISVTYHDGSSVRYIYQGLCHQETVRYDAQQQERYRHKVQKRDLAGRVLELSLSGNAQPIAFSYDCKGRMTSLDHPHLKGKFTYSQKGTLQAAEYDDAFGHEEKQFTYNTQNQLIHESGANTYAYDNLGNRRHVNGTAYTLCQNTNRILEIEGRKFTYDDSGNLLSDGIRTYGYDSLDRLTEVKKENSLWKYTYDAFHRRISKEEYLISQDKTRSLQNTERYVYIGFNEAGAVDENNQFTALRVFGQGKNAHEAHAATIELEGKAYAPIYDHQGSLRTLIDIETGRIAASFRYDAFGNIKEEQDITTCPWKYLGKRYDPETGFSYFGRRYYIPEIGRWLTLDPSGYSSGANGYLFVKNNPLTLFDLYGLYEFNPLTFAMNFAGSFLFHTISNLPRFGLLSKILAFFPYLMMQKPVEEYNAYYGYENSSSFLVGEPEPNAKTGLVTVCGIMNNMTGATDMAVNVRKGYETGSVVNIHNSSHGFLMDLLECIAQKLGIRTRSVDVTVEELRNLCNAHDKVIVSAHSQGALIVACALEYLTPEELSKLHIRTYGGASMILNNQVASCHNYVCSSDPVPFITDPIKIIYALLTGDKRLEMITSQQKNKNVWEHSICGPTYTYAIQDAAKKDRERGLL